MRATRHGGLCQELSPLTVRAWSAVNGPFQPWLGACTPSTKTLARLKISLDTGDWGLPAGPPANLKNQNQGSFINGRTAGPTHTDFKQQHAYSGRSPRSRVNCRKLGWRVRL
jgi:hypothetical protein